MFASVWFYIANTELIQLQLKPRRSQDARLRKEKLL